MFEVTGVDFSSMLDVAKFLWAIGLVVVGGYVAVTRARMKAIEEKLEAVDKARAAAVGQLRDELAFLKAQADHAPTKDDLHDVSNRVEQLSGDVKQLTATIQPIGASLSRVEQYLMEHASK